MRDRRLPRYTESRCTGRQESLGTMMPPTLWPAHGGVAFFCLASQKFFCRALPSLPGPKRRCVDGRACCGRDRQPGLAHA